MSEKRKGGVLLLGLQSIIVETLQAARAAASRELEIPEAAIRVQVDTRSSSWRFWKKELVVDATIDFGSRAQRDSLQRVCPDLRFWSMSDDDVDEVLRKHTSAAMAAASSRVESMNVRR